MHLCMPNTTYVTLTIGHQSPKAGVVQVVDVTVSLSPPEIIPNVLRCRCPASRRGVPVGGDIGEGEGRAENGRGEEGRETGKGGETRGGEGKGREGRGARVRGARETLFCSSLQEASLPNGYCTPIPQVARRKYCNVSGAGKLQKEQAHWPRAVTK